MPRAGALLAACAQIILENYPATPEEITDARVIVEEMLDKHKAVCQCGMDLGTMACVQVHNTVVQYALTKQLGKLNTCLN